MKSADLNRFLVICALVSDLYCPGYNSRQSLEKNSNLARAAARYKLDSAKIATAVRAELSKPAKKVKHGSQPISQPRHGNVPKPPTADTQIERGFSQE